MSSLSRLEKHKQMMIKNNPKLAKLSSWRSLIDNMTEADLDRATTTAQEEIGSGTHKSWNIEREYKAIQNFVESRGYKNKYEEGRHKTLKYILNKVYHDPEKGDWDDDNNIKLIKEAGQLLYDFDGMKSMKDNLVWSFIPVRYHREISSYWNGIGEWLD
tara:strand:- start:2712 stop:3188 length:477 start_codon:yes stop_codon:yes gene_type:complete